MVFWKWLEKLKKDKKFIVHASGQAQKAVDYILNEKGVEKDVQILANNIISDEEEISEKKVELTKSRLKGERKSAKMEMSI